MRSATSIAGTFGGRVSGNGLPLRAHAVDGGAFGAARLGRITIKDGSPSAPEVQYHDVPTQEDALQLICDIMEDGAQKADVQKLARVLTANCPARNDWCELTAIYNAVKSGRADLGAWGLTNGVRYMADARTARGDETDVYFAPGYLLAMLREGANGFDCDDQTMLIGALAKNCGFRVGARAYGEGNVHGFEHVYPIALIPKRGPWNADAQGRVDESFVVGLDATVPYARVGWQPPVGSVYTALLN